MILLHNSIEATQASTSDLDQSTQSRISTPSTEPEQLSAAWTSDVVDSLEKQGATLQEATVATDPDIPTDLKEEAEKENAKVYKTKWEDLPDNIQDWIKAHPYQTAFHVVSGVVFFAPAAASGPVLYLLGFGSLGPRAASFASFLQSKLGIVAAKSGFAFLQSAGMGGYGLAAVNAATQFSAAAGSFGAGLWGWASGNGTADAGKTKATDTDNDGTAKADGNIPTEVDENEPAKTGRG